MAESALGNLDRAGANVSSAAGGIDRPVAPEVRTVALSISPDLVHQGVVDLKGYRVSSAEDLAKLAQVYRDPRFETFRMIYVKGNQVVGHEGMASRLPAVVQLFNSVGGFLAMQYHGRVYLRTDSDRHGFVQIAGHELLHQIRKDSPELYEWFSEQATTYMRSGAEFKYGKRLAAVGANLDTTDVREEILADFTGDALADPRFLETLATRNPSKFAPLTETVVNRAQVGRSKAL